MTGKEFRSRRERLGWTQKDAGEALGLTVQQVSHIENGRTGLSRSAALLFDLYRPFEHAGDLARLLEIGRQYRGHPQRTLESDE